MLLDLLFLEKLDSFLSSRSSIVSVLSSVNSLAITIGTPFPEFIGFSLTI